MYEITLRVYVPYSAGEYETQIHEVKDIDELMELLTRLNPEQGEYEDDDSVNIIGIVKKA